MVIAVDAMGGDHAPGEIVRGALLAAQQEGAQVLLVGRKDAVLASLGTARRAEAPGVEIVEASEVIEMCEPPAQAVRRKRDASLVVCGELVRSGRADAMVSAGNTGAAMAVALTRWGRISGIDRPAIATLLPTMTGRVVLLDAGANVDCTPLNLYQFAWMGSIYAESVLGISRPRVGVLSNGAEEGKGNEQIRAAYALLQEAPLRFAGNIEGRELFHGHADVVVCDGFVGNVVLKVGEGVVELLKDMIKQQLRAQPWLMLPAAMLGPAVRQIRRRTDYSETGGAPLLGVNGVCIISHGRSSARAIANAIRAAREAVKHEIVGQIARQLSGAFDHA